MPRTKKTVLTENVESNGHTEKEVRKSQTPISKAAKKEAQTYTRGQILQLVEFYVKAQKMRVGTRNAESAHERGSDEQQINLDLDVMDYIEQEDGEEPPLAVSELTKNLQYIEAQAKTSMRYYAKSHPVGRWLLSLAGIGEVVAASLLAYVDFKRCCCDGYGYNVRGGDRDNIPDHDCPGLTTAGYLWSYAGIFPRPWEKGRIRPFNSRLKSVLLQYVGKSLKTNSVSEEDARKTVKQIEQQIKELMEEEGKEVDPKFINKMAVEKWGRFQKRIKQMETDPSYLYCRIYRKYKTIYQERNERGGFREMADTLLPKLDEYYGSKAKKVQETWFSSPKRQALVDGRINQLGVDRYAVRKAVTIMLSHFHEVGRAYHFPGQPLPFPWILTDHAKKAGLGGHTHYIPVPNWPKDIERPPMK